MNLPEKHMTLQATLEQQTTREKKFSSSEWFGWFGRVALLLAVLFAPWAFGSIGSTYQYWMSVAILIGLALWWFETALHHRDSQVFPYLFFLVAGGVVIGLLQLMPLPDAIANLVSGRQGELYERFSVDPDVILKSDQSVNVPTRITLNQEGTYYQLRLLVIAIGGLLLGCRFFRSRNHVMLLLGTISFNGAAIAFFGILQKLTSKDLLYWTFAVPEGGNPFGPFVNRNNCAGYLLLCLAAAIGLAGMVLTSRKTAGPKPMVSKEIPPWRQAYFHLLFFVAELTAVKLATLLGIVLISLGIVGSLSRGAVLALLIASIVTLVIYGLARKPKYTGFILFPLMALILGMSTWLGFGEKFVARIETVDVEEIVTTEQRFKNWKDTYPAVGDMGIFGSGLGAYANVHRIYRTDREDKMFAYAENQYFQALVEAGWVGFILFLLAWLLCWKYAVFLLYRGTSSSTIAFGTMAVFLLVSQAVAATFDFGFYIPANMLLLSVLAGFMAFQAQALGGRLKKKNLFRFQFPNFAVQVILLVVFAAATITTFDLYRKKALDSAISISMRDVDYKTLNLEQTEVAIKKITPLLERKMSAEGFNHVGALWIHRSRLQYLQELSANLPVLNLMGADEKQVAMDRIWGKTELGWMQEYLQVQKRDFSQMKAKKFLDNSFISFDLLQAHKFYSLSRQISPLQPFVDVRLGKINALIGSEARAEVDFERAIELSPSNVDLRLAASIHYLQTDRPEKAAKHIHEFIKLDPKGFRPVLDMATGRTERRITPIENETIFEQVIPEDARLLYQFATRYLNDGSELKMLVLEKADNVMGEALLSQTEDVLLSADIKLAMGDFKNGIMRLQDALISNPGDTETRMRLARVYLKNEMLEEAMKEAAYLHRLDSRDDGYARFHQDVLDAIRERRRDEEKEKDRLGNQQPNN